MYIYPVLFDILLKSFYSWCACTLLNQANLESNLVLVELRALSTDWHWKQNIRDSSSKLFICFKRARYLYESKREGITLNLKSLPNTESANKKAQERKEVEILVHISNHLPVCTVKACE